jgi:hypothetical protein
MREWLIDVCLVLAEWLGYQPPVHVCPVPDTRELDTALETLAQVRRMLEERDVEIANLEEAVAHRDRRIEELAAVVPKVDESCLARAREVVRDLVAATMGGEAKRHAAYARLIKEFPETPKRQLALAIELALLQAP